MTDKVGRSALWAAVDLHTVPMSNRPAPHDYDDQASSFDVITALIARGATIEAAVRQQVPYRTKLDRGGDGVLGPGTTPLLRAGKAADTPVIKLLLEKGANPRAITANGVNTLMMAANVAAKEEDMTGRGKTQQAIIDSATLLLAAGVDINAADSQGRTAAHGAAIWGLSDVIRFLHSKGAKLDQRDKRGLSALDAAMGKAGGFGFDGRSGVERPETVKVIRELLGPEAAEAAINKAPPAAEPDAARQRQLNGQAGDSQ
jgi:ankyrin repeat protein